jgi:lauroyl/myristoyl acyltransferase
MFEHHTENERILHQNKLGTIAQCFSCEKISIIVNNLNYVCNEQEYNELFKIVENIDHNLENYICEIMGVNYVIINTPIDKVNLIFNLNEIENLTELLNQSKYMLEVHKLFH